MKIAVVHNRESRKVINLFGLPNKETIGLRTVKRITDALKAGGHQAMALEGDKDLVDRLEDFMPRVLKGERPGMAFNVSYGIQGQARYTHVPSILEMVGIPYVASGPLAHSLALDKVVTKMILRQHHLPTPEFAVLDTPEAPVPDRDYPLIVKPKNEAISFGLKVVDTDKEFREAAAVIFDEYRQPVLVERYIEGRQVNVGLLGNSPPETFPPAEFIFDAQGPKIYTYEDKTGRSGRTISYVCPAPLGEELSERGIAAVDKQTTKKGKEHPGHARFVRVRRSTMRTRTVVLLSGVALAGCGNEPTPNPATFSMTIITDQMAPAIPHQKCVLLVSVADACERAKRG